MKLHKQLKWLNPYLEEIGHMAPIKKLARINLTFYDNPPPAVAECTQHPDGKFSIVIRLPSTQKNQIPFHFSVQEDVLWYLSHEVSHMTHWDHSTERILLESLIYHQFAVTLHRLGYEEHRNKVKKRRRA